MGLLLGSSARAEHAPRDDRAIILLMLVGGPSQFETFDPKPDAPDEIRGPFGSVATSVPGIRVSEHLPRLARRMDRLTLIRSLHHDSAPIHETGHQLLQTGRLARPGLEWPHVGAVASRLLGPRGGAPPFVVLPGPIGNTGVGVSHGQEAGLLGPGSRPFIPGEGQAPSSFASFESLPFSASTTRAFDVDAEPNRLRDAYGHSPFGRSCLLARRLVAAGSRVVVVNMYPTVFGLPTWDCHGRAPFSTLSDCRETVLPDFDRAFSALIDDLGHEGLLGSTLVVATGEFGRTPKINASGGRDHWPGVWSAVMAGGETPAGSVIGSSDRQGAEPADHPVHAADLAATLYRFLGIDPSRPIPLSGGESLVLIDKPKPIVEALA
jgi:hypothetical protein